MAGAVLGENSEARMTDGHVADVKAEYDAMKGELKKSVKLVHSKG